MNAYLNAYSDIVDCYMRDLEKTGKEYGADIAEDIFERCKTFYNVSEYYIFAKAGWEHDSLGNYIYCDTCKIKAKPIFNYECPFVVHAALSTSCNYVKLFKVNLSNVDIEEIKSVMLF
jgi:hypothetical protein